MKTQFPPILLPSIRKTKTKTNKNAVSTSVHISALGLYDKFVDSPGVCVCVWFFHGFKMVKIDT